MYCVGSVCWEKGNCGPCGTQFWISVQDCWAARKKGPFLNTWRATIAFGMVPARHVFKKTCVYCMHYELFNLYALRIVCTHMCSICMRTVYLDCWDKVSWSELVGDTRTPCNPTHWQPDWNVRTSCSVCCHTLNEQPERTQGEDAVSRIVSLFNLFSCFYRKQV